MTLDEAIAESATGTIKPGHTCESWMRAMVDVARGGSSYAWGILWGAYEACPALVRQHLESYWRTQGPPAQPKPEWREVTDSRKLVGRLPEQIDWVKDSDGPIQEVGIRMPGGTHLRFVADIEPCFSGKPGERDGYALARCVLRVEERTGASHEDSD